MQTPQHPTALSISVREAARLTSFSEFEIRNAVNSGHLPAIRLGRRIAILTTDLKAWLESLKKVGDVA